MSRPTSRELLRAREVVSERLAPTPLLAAGGELDGWSLKLESLQPTGSFKVRGALAVCAHAVGGGPLVTASSGNHALAMAWAGARLGVEVTVVVPETAAAPKVEALRRMQARVELAGADYSGAERHAFALAESSGGRFVSAYNDAQVIAGQSTLGWEVLGQAEEPLTVVCPVGGGGLLAGLCMWAMGRPEVTLIGVEPAASAALSTAVRSGRIEDVPIGPTLSDGTAGNIEPGSVTVPIVADRVDELVTVSEDEIRAAIRWLATRCGVVAEGSGACAAAAALSGAARVRGRGALVVSGRNIAPEVLARTLSD